jgi:hypothetical protein
MIVAQQNCERTECKNILPYGSAIVSANQPVASSNRLHLTAKALVGEPGSVANQGRINTNSQFKNIGFPANSLGFRIRLLQ